MEEGRVGNARSRPRSTRAENCQTSRLALMPMTYTDEERARAIAWKQATETLPDTAKRPAR